MDKDKFQCVYSRRNIPSSEHREKKNTLIKCSHRDLLYRTYGISNYYDI